MTPTKRCFVEIEDILGVQYECRNCHAATVVPVKKLRDARQTSQMFIAQCQYCQTPWGFQPNGEDARIFGEFNELLRDVERFLKGKNMRFQLEIKCRE